MPAFLTASGLQKLAVATPEQPMTVKYMAIGTGTGAPTENIGALFNEVYRIEIPNPLRDPSNPRNLEFTGHIPTTVGGWTITELGLYDSNGVLVAYDLLSESIVKSPPDSALKTDMYPTIVIALSNTEETTLIVSSSIEFDHAALTGRSKANSHPLSAIGGLQDALDQKTTDLNNHIAYSASRDQSNVKISGGQKIAGIKQFHSPIVSDGANITDIPLKNVTGLSGFKDEFDSGKVTKIITADYTILTTDSGLIEVDASSGPIVITVAQSSRHITKNITLIRLDGTANQVKINPSAGNVFRGEGVEYSSMNLRRYETFLMRAGTMSWVGARSLSTIISRDESTGRFNFVDRGAALAEIPFNGKLVGDGSGLNMLGWGQTTQNVTSSRSAGVTYTNQTSKPIEVSIYLDASGVRRSAIFYRNSILLGAIGNEEQHDTPKSMSFVVPSESTYRVDGAFTSWVELR